jgi:Bacterial regulatory proteins, luxR family
MSRLAWSGFNLHVRLLRAKSEYGTNEKDLSFVCSVALFISEKTAKSHVGNILNKLHLADRTQAAVYAWRRGLIE